MSPVTEKASPIVVRRREMAVFLVLTGVIMPALAVAVVGAYGFVIWVYQMFAGPPGPPGA